MIDTLLAWDAALRGWLSSWHNGPLDSLMLALSFVGRGGTIWLVLGFGLAARRRSRARGAWQLALAIGLTSLLVEQAIKPAVARPRPFDGASSEVRLIDRRPAGASFPSGHAANAAAGAYAVARFWPQGKAVVWTLAVLISFSRVYVGAHYPLDVIGGACVGLLCAGVVIGGTRWASSPW
ncbi:MAG: phosphatase PAP2 family protein [Acidobacteria bacterium]|nr:phosphatase PAP2 family protein [Acidobacteriota bacterium]